MQYAVGPGRATASRRELDSDELDNNRELSCGELDGGCGCHHNRCWHLAYHAPQAHLLYSDALLQIFFLAFTLYGWWYWWRGVRDDGEVRIARLPTRSLLTGLASGAVGGFALGFLMKQIHGTALPFLDAMLTSYSLVASWWAARKHIANWWLWIAVDLVYIGEYVYKNLRLTAALYAFLVALAVLGLRDWRRAAAHE
jgi:nicotinamide mononucleotide transporter